MKLIVGLGNPGDKYINTRHNFGFMVVEHFVRDYPGEVVWGRNDKLKSDIATLEWQPKEGKLEKVILAKPQTYMNNSGMAVSLLANYYKIDPSDIWIVYDELDLPIGAMRIRFGGAAAGHHGVESIIESLGTDQFWRFRLGIGNLPTHSGRMARDEGREHTIGGSDLGNAQDYVLSTFGNGEHGKARELLKHATDSLELALEKGLEASMNRYNTK